MNNDEYTALSAGGGKATIPTSKIHLALPVWGETIASGRNREERHYLHRLVHEKTLIDMYHRTLYLFE